MRTILRVLTALLLTTPALAGDDPSIVEPLRSAIQSSITDWIASNSADGTLLHFDAVAGELLELTKPSVHAGIVRKGAFFVSCADFVDQRGRTIDLDFLVVTTSDGLRTTQAIVHKTGDRARPYHLE